MPGWLFTCILAPQQLHVISSLSARSVPQNRMTVLPEADRPVVVDSFTKPNRQEGIIKIQKIV